MEKVLVIAAHPDDEILGCGGFISKYQSQGVMFKILFIGEGATCRFSDISDEEATAAVKLRNFSALKALSIFKIDDVDFNNFPCGRFDQMPIIEINKIIERAVDDY